MFHSWPTRRVVLCSTKADDNRWPLHSAPLIRRWANEWTWCPSKTFCLILSPTDWHRRLFEISRSAIDDDNNNRHGTTTRRKKKVFLFLYSTRGPAVGRKINQEWWTDLSRVIDDSQPSPLLWLGSTHLTVTLSLSFLIHLLLIIFYVFCFSTICINIYLFPGRFLNIVVVVVLS